MQRVTAREIVPHPFNPGRAKELINVYFLHLYTTRGWVSKPQISGIAKSQHCYAKTRGESIAVNAFCWKKHSKFDRPFGRLTNYCCALRRTRHCDSQAQKARNQEKGLLCLRTLEHSRTSSQKGLSRRPPRESCLQQFLGLRIPARLTAPGPEAVDTAGHRPTLQPDWTEKAQPRGWASAGRTHPGLSARSPFLSAAAAHGTYSFRCS